MFVTAARREPAPVDSTTIQVVSAIPSTGKYNPPAVRRPDWVRSSPGVGGQSRRRSGDRIEHPDIAGVRAVIRLPLRPGARRARVSGLRQPTGALSVLQREAAAVEPSERGRETRGARNTRERRCLTPRHLAPPTRPSFPGTCSTWIATRLAAHLHTIQHRNGWAMRLPDRMDRRYGPAGTTLTVVSRTRVIVCVWSEPDKETLPRTRPADDAKEIALAVGKKLLARWVPRRPAVPMAAAAPGCHRYREFVRGHSIVRRRSHHVDSTSRPPLSGDCTRSEWRPRRAQLVFRAPSAKNPIDRLSGDQKGCEAPLVPQPPTARPHRTSGPRVKSCPRGAR